MINGIGELLPAYKDMKFRVSQTLMYKVNDRKNYGQVVFSYSLGGRLIDPVVIVKMNFGRYVADQIVESV